MRRNSLKRKAVISFLSSQLPLFEKWLDTPARTSAYWCYGVVYLPKYNRLGTNIVSRYPVKLCYPNQ
jgi:hypothetical protein